MYICMCITYCPAWHLRICIQSGMAGVHRPFSGAWHSTILWRAVSLCSHLHGVWHWLFDYRVARKWGLGGRLQKFPVRLMSCRENSHRIKNPKYQDLTCNLFGNLLFDLKPIKIPGFMHVHTYTYIYKCMCVYTMYSKNKIPKIKSKREI